MPPPWFSLNPFVTLKCFALSYYRLQRAQAKVKPTDLKLQSVPLSAKTEILYCSARKQDLVQFIVTLYFSKLPPH